MADPAAARYPDPVKRAFGESGAFQTLLRSRSATVPLL
jgi:hypothetical protein